MLIIGFIVEKPMAAAIGPDCVRERADLSDGRSSAVMDWEDRLDNWELELELTTVLEGSDWVTLERAAAETGASRAAIRSWYRTGEIPSRLVDGPHGPQRLVPLAPVAARAEASPRLRRTAQRRLADEAQLEILRHRVDQLELRLAALEQSQPPEPPD